MKKYCRCCGIEIDANPILHYDDMPGAAQNFPTKDEISKDKGIALNLYQCSYCGLIQILDEPVSYYRDVIRASAVSEEMKEFRLRYFEDFVTKYNLKGKKILEVGAGRGEFLRLMNAVGVEGHGIEHLQSSVDYCNKEGLSVYQGYLEDKNTVITNAPFDGFFIMNFLEHAPNPNSFLQGVHSNLTDDAIGLIEVPNVDMILKSVMFSEFISDHLLYFTRDVLTLLLEKNGFDVIECKSVWHDYCLAAIVKKKKSINMKHFYDKLSKVSEEINSYIDENQKKGSKVAIWGAGHQALAVIALCKIKNKIKFVVDSAKFKQGKYTQGTHIEIVSPEKLHDSTDVRAIIVMAASYSDEVADVIRKEYSNINVAILREDGLEYR